MENITFTASATFTEEQVIYYAKSIGWDENNDQTAKDFVQEYIKNKLIWIIGQPTKQIIAQKHENNKKNELQEYNNELAQIITVEQ